MEDITQCNFASHYLSVDGAKIHYYDEGRGDPMLFLHGIPTSAYLWRQIIPTLTDQARCIAPDLIGMGKSDKPDIAYRISDHIHYIESFIEQLGLKNITLVLHGWGSVIGFHYASRHLENIKGLVFYESHIKPERHWRELSLPVQQLASLMRQPEKAKRAVIEQNYLINRLLPSAAIRELSEQEKAQYLAPFQTPQSRLPLWQYLQDLPLGSGPDDVVNLIAHYSNWLQETAIPKLLLYAVPGFMTTIDTVQWAKTHLKNLTLVALDDALHLAQETSPTQFAQAVLTWYQQQEIRA